MMRSLPVDSKHIATYSKDASRSNSREFYDRHLENTAPLKQSSFDHGALANSSYDRRDRVDSKRLTQVHCNNNSVLLRSEIDMLNNRLDRIDRHCMEFTKMATEKAKLEDNLKNLAYLHMLEAEQSGKLRDSSADPYNRQSKRDDHDRSLTRDPTFNPNGTGSAKRDQFPRPDLVE